MLRLILCITAFEHVEHLQTGQIVENVRRLFQMCPTKYHTPSTIEYVQIISGTTFAMVNFTGGTCEGGTHLCAGTLIGQEGGDQRSIVERVKVANILTRRLYLLLSTTKVQFLIRR